MKRKCHLLVLFGVRLGTKETKETNCATIDGHSPMFILDKNQHTQPTKYDMTYDMTYDITYDMKYDMAYDMKYDVTYA